MTRPGTERVPSGGIELLLRRFGTPGRGPGVLILHGAGYYDSADWIAVASALSADGSDVAAFDARGYGGSDWSPEAEYGIDAQLGDIRAVIDHVGWAAPVFLAHSRGGALALQFAARYPERVGAIIFADACPGRTARGPAPAPAPGRAAPADQHYPSLEAALAATSRDPRSLEDPAKRARLEEIFTPCDDGYALTRRDPRFGQGSPGAMVDGWTALAALAMPLLFVRAKRSLSFDAVSWQRAQTLPDASFVEIDSGHDLANEAPEALIGAVSEFVDSLVGSPR